MELDKQIVETHDEIDMCKNKKIYINYINSTVSHTLLTLLNISEMNDFNYNSNLLAYSNTL